MSCYMYIRMGDSCPFLLGLLGLLEGGMDMGEGVREDREVGG